MPEPPVGEGRCRVGSAPAPGARQETDGVAGEAEVARQRHNVLLPEQGLEMRVLMAGVSSSPGMAPSATTCLPWGPTGGDTGSRDPTPAPRRAAPSAARRGDGSPCRRDSVSRGDGCPQPRHRAHWVRLGEASWEWSPGGSGSCGDLGDGSSPHAASAQSLGEPWPGHLLLSVGHRWSGTYGPPKAAGSSRRAGVDA